MFTKGSKAALTAMVCFRLLVGEAAAQIDASVGVNCDNAAADVKQVQTLLNAISDISGGPETPLIVDGKVGPATLAAIQRFQRTQLGFEDGCVKPGEITELRLLRLNGIDVLLGDADTHEEIELAKFTTTYMNIVVIVDGKKVSVRPPYHINTGKRKSNAQANRNDNPEVEKLIERTVGVGSATVGKATPEQIGNFLQAAIDAKLVDRMTPQGMRSFLAKYGISTDCSGLASRACNLLSPENPLDVVNRANTAYLAKLTLIAAPSDLKAGHMMVKGGSHVRLLTDVDVGAEGIEFTTLESTASRIYPDGDGISERRWRFPSSDQFSGLQELKKGSFQTASTSDASYIYTKK